MKNTLKLSLSVAALLFLFNSFTYNRDSKFIGTYGDERMQLILNEDYTFTFRSTFDVDNKIIHKGTWEIKRGKAYLICENPNSAMPVKWKFKNEGKTIKSRNKFVFYTLNKE